MVLVFLPSPIFHCRKSEYLTPEQYLTPDQGSRAAQQGMLCRAAASSTNDTPAEKRSHLSPPFLSLRALPLTITEMVLLPPPGCPCSPVPLRAATSPEHTPTRAPARKGGAGWFCAPTPSFLAAPSQKGHSQAPHCLPLPQIHTESWLDVSLLCDTTLLCCVQTLQKGLPNPCKANLLRNPASSILHSPLPLLSPSL